MVLLHESKLTSKNLSKFCINRCKGTASYSEFALNPAREKMNQHAVNILRLKMMTLEDKKRCLKCFCKIDICMCKKVHDICSSVKLPGQITLFTHYREWGKSSNTGKILKFGLPDNTKEYIFGVQADEAKFLKELESKPSIVLFPSTKSVPISSMKGWYAGHKGDINLCVIDSTWGQSSPMIKFIPESVPRVHVNDLIDGPSLYLNRKQSPFKYKVSTVESICYALRGLGESDSITEPLFDALRYSVDTICFQRNHSTFYGSDFPSKKHDPTIVTNDN